MPKKKRNIAAICVMVLGLFVFLFVALPYAINVCTNHRLHYFVRQARCILAETHYENIGFTPDKKYSLHLLVVSWLSTEYKIEASTPFSLRPKEVLFFAEEHFKIPAGPLSTEKNTVVCSKDSRYIALIICGWYVDCYDFLNHTNISPEKRFFMGDYEKKESEDNFHILRDYHNQIALCIGNDTIPILKLKKEDAE